MNICTVQVKFILLLHDEGWNHSEMNSSDIGQYSYIVAYLENTRDLTLNLPQKVGGGIRETTGSEPNCGVPTQLYTLKFVQLNYITTRVKQ